MDKFTLSAIAASGVMVGAAAIAAWAPGQEVHALVRPGTDAPKAEPAPQPQPCPHGSPSDIPGLDRSAAPAETESGEAESTPLAYAPANRGGHTQRIDAGPSAEEFDRAGAAAIEPDGIETGAAPPVAPDAGKAPIGGLRSGGNLEVVEGSFVAASSAAIREGGGDDSEAALDILSSGALAHFAGMNAEQIEAFTRLAATIRHPELAAAFASQEIRNERGGSEPSVLPPIGFETGPSASEQADDEPARDREAEWTAVESLDGTVRLVLAGDERTALPIRKGMIVGSRGKVERIVRSGTELAVLFENGDEIVGNAAARPLSVPLLRPDAPGGNGA